MATRIVTALWPPIEPPRAGTDLKAAGDEKLFELDALDNFLGKRHTKATSARNLLACHMTCFWGVNNRMGVELARGSHRLVSQIMQESVREIYISVRTEVMAVINAPSCRKLI